MRTKTRRVTKGKALTTKAVASDTIRFHYIKSNFFRVLHVDGVVGAVTPQLGIHMSVFSERPAIPQQTEVELVDGALGDELRDQRIGKTGVVREMDADLILSESTAQAMVEWLQQKLSALKQLREHANKVGSKR